ncbi:MAG: nickel-responsive transcriptional regulator NikR [Spirochaetes bacterium]|nr:MAG: nickel-responsive transcriptional regulator NikR [Spirochaetota bacterium]RKY03434.1 MAG: nickel-responsive transcriptional regulator NikR [Spirochaetota bacterium]
MSELIRFGVSMDKNLLDNFDHFIQEHGFHNRSEAIRDLIREKLALEKGVSTHMVIGTVTIVYNHHIRNLTERLTDIQHNYQKNILFSNHIHITHEYCMEVIVVVGEERKLREFTNKIGGQKGVMMALPSFLALELEGIDLKDLEMGDRHHH